MKYKIFQICFEPKQIHDVDPLLTPFDNTSNERPELREYHSFERIIKEGVADELDAWGVFGPRWHEKMRYDSFEMHKAIRENPDADVWIFNHARVVNALTHNQWEQGEFWHKGIIAVTKKAFESAGYDPSYIDRITVETTCYCSYFVAKKDFWLRYIDFIRDIKSALESLDEEHKLLYQSSANYARDKNLNLFPFIVERLFSTFLLMDKFNVYSHNHDFYLYKNQIEDFSVVLNSIYQLKKLGQHDERILPHWNNIRTFFLTTQPQLLSLD